MLKSLVLKIIMNYISIVLVGILFRIFFYKNKINKASLYYI